MKKEGVRLVFVVFISFLLTISFVSASFFGDMSKWMNNPSENQKSYGELYSSPSQRQIVAYYPFDENANDASGNGNNGAVNGAVLVDGKKIKAYSFNGVNSYIDAGNRESLKPKKVTISAWIKTSSSGNERFIAGFGNLDYTNPRGYWIGINRYGNAMLYIGTNSNYDYITVANRINDNQWHHIAGTYDGMLAKIYIDGVLIGSTDSANGDIAYTGLSSFKVGKIDSAIISISPWEGLIDEVKVLNDILTDNEIKAEYDATVGSGGGSCTANCAGKQCGSDGCEGSCGTCTTGYTCDVNAQCVAPVCTDSDNGLNYYLKGTTSGYDEPTREYVTINDYCEFNYSLKEYSCEGIYGKENEYICPNGCSDGACISEPTCTDSDGGQDYYVKGTVSYGNWSKTDRCGLYDDNPSNDSTDLNEFYCRSDGEPVEEVYKCPNGCSDGKCLTPQPEVCPVLINRVKNPTDFVEGYRGYKLNYNSIAPGSIWMEGEEKPGINYYASWNYYQQEVSEYFSYSIFVADDKNLNLNEYVEKIKENPYCKAREDWQGGNQRVYICAWNLMEDMPNTGKSLQIMWAKDNVLIESYISHWEGGEELTDEQISKLINEKTLSFIRNLEDNEFKGVGGDNFNIDYPLSAQIEKALSECKSDIPAGECISCWSCKTEPAICPPHGYQNKVCVDRCCNKPSHVEEKECSPGICAGCYVPRWYGWNIGNNVCIPYGTRFSHTETDEDGDIPEGYNEGPNSAMNLTIYSNKEAYFYLKEGDIVFFDSNIYVGNEYEIDLTNAGEGAIIRFRVDDIVPATENRNGYISITVLQNFNAYCDYTGRIERQKMRTPGGDWATCQNNYECESNFCSSGECLEITTMIKNAKGFKATFIKILCRLGNIFDIESYEQCVARSIA
ncbi:MAG: LamG domain-containing protein [Candidatus Nanoarchaeia archaeon]|nr:LamG domain-containing protein [Candidatus Nanoarchaeia archaeon]